MYKNKPDIKDVKGYMLVFIATIKRLLKIGDDDMSLILNLVMYYNNRYGVDNYFLPEFKNREHASSYIKIAEETIGYKL